MPFTAADELAPPLAAPEQHQAAEPVAPATGVPTQKEAPPPILLLPEAEVAKIKAGEVVERPASVVKELVENALDAGALRIAVELEDGGRRLVRVTDNGYGIPAGELPLALLRHATSKIRRLDDLYGLATLGFRGEGLAAIAAVSRLRLESRSSGAGLGAVIASDGAEAPGSAPRAMQPGTVVEVRDLFWNVPARLKFLRSPAAETSQTAALLTAYALAYPEVQFTLSSGGRTLLRSEGDGDGRAALADACGLPGGVGRASAPAAVGSRAGTPAPSPLLPIAFDFPPMAVRGWISEPRLHRHNRSRQWFFVNRRPVSNKLLFRAVDDSVREFMSEGKFPQGAFFLDLPPEEIDVNVHPMKLEVSFAQPQAVYSLLTTAIRRGLGTAAVHRQRQLSGGLAGIVQPLRRTDKPAQPPHDDGPYTPPLLDAPPPGHVNVPVFDVGRPFVAPQRNEELITTKPLRGDAASQDNAEERLSGFNPAVPKPADLSSLHLSALSALSGENSTVPTAAPHVTAIQQVANAYLALLTPEAVYLVDQHAAHERILFETLYERLQARPDAPPPPRQKLLFPLEVQLGAGEAGLAADYCRELAKLGFVAGYDESRHALSVSEVPLMLAGRITGELLQGSLAELAELGHSALLAEQGKRLAASLACRAAIKAGDRLPVEEQRALVAQLLSRWSSLSCPHGRPTILRLGPGEMEGMFLR